MRSVALSLSLRCCSALYALFFSAADVSLPDPTHADQPEGQIREGALSRAAGQCMLGLRGRNREMNTDHNPRSFPELLVQGLRG